MHAIVTEDRQYRSFAKERERIRSAQNKFQLRVAAEEADYRRKLAEYNADQEACLLRGEAPGYKRPSPPVHDQNAAMVFQSKLIEVDAAERAWMGRRADDLMEAIARRETELSSAAMEVYRRLDAIASEVEELRHTAFTVRLAAERGPAVSSRPVTAMNLRDAVELGRSAISSSSVMVGPGGTVSPPMNLDDVDISADV